MKQYSIKAILLCTSIILSSHLSAETKITNKDLQKAHSLIKTFGGELKSVLKTAIKAGGPVNAINVCNLQAEPIAEEVSSHSDWQISRTSLKVRNENNTPDEWELKALLQFEQRKAAGENLKTIEYSELVTEGGQSVYRYMKAIPTAGLCMTCHGSNLDNAVSEKLKVLYPQDQAVGYRVGDLRGAFSLQKIKQPKS